jgi:VWFA-related protein
MRVLVRRILLFTLWPLASRTLEAQAGAHGSLRLRVETSVVEIEVLAEDANHRPVGDLGREDFEIKDLGKSRPIQIFRSGRDAPTIPSERVKRPGATVFSNSETSLPTGESTSVLLLDADHSDSGGLALARAHVLHAIPQLRRSGRIAIYLLNNGELSVLQPFTLDRGAALQSVMAYAPGAAKPRIQAGWKYAGPEAVPTRADIEYSTDKDQAETTAAFNTIAENLRAMPGRKVIVWLTAGFPPHGSGHIETVGNPPSLL